MSASSAAADTHRRRDTARYTVHSARPHAATQHIMLNIVKFSALVALCCLLVAADAQMQHRPRPRPRPSRREPPLCVRHSVTPVSCANVSSADSLLPHPDDCRLFYYCEPAHRRPSCRQCPARLHFNPVSHVCDWPASAGCSGGPATSTPASTSTAPAESTASPSTEAATSDSAIEQNNSTSSSSR